MPFVKLGNSVFNTDQIVKAVKHDNGDVTIYYAAPAPASSAPSPGMAGLASGPPLALKRLRGQEAADLWTAL